MFSSTTALPIGAFFLFHWWGSVLMQTLFLHRYASHGMFTMSRGWERFFHFLTYFFQGSSYLIPRAYAYLHRAHHAYSDTEKDPHSPHFYTNVFSMMWRTKASYSGLVTGKEKPEPRFAGATPTWDALDRFGDSLWSRGAWMVAYTAFYLVFAPHWAFLLLLPVHFLMGPIHGAIVNWAGHKYGYRNFDSSDHSRNVLVWDLVTLGELFQNNHHRFGQSPKFAVRWFEIDPTYPLVLLLDKLGVLDLSGKASLPQAQPGTVPAE